MFACCPQCEIFHASSRSVARDRCSFVVLHTKRRWVAWKCMHAKGDRICCCEVESKCLREYGSFYRAFFLWSILTSNVFGIFSRVCSVIHFHVHVFGHFCCVRLLMALQLFGYICCVYFVSASHLFGDICCVCVVFFGVCQPARMKRRTCRPQHRKILFELKMSR